MSLETITYLSIAILRNVPIVKYFPFLVVDVGPAYEASAGADTSEKD
jgi:hypothetical protein